MCLYLLRGYADRKRTSIFIRVLTFVGWFLSFSLVVFLPLDIYMAKKMSLDVATENDVSREPYLFDWWAFTYWIGNMLSYFVIPLVQGYVLAGEF